MTLASFIGETARPLAIYALAIACAIEVVRLHHVDALMAGGAILTGLVTARTIDNVVQTRATAAVAKAQGANSITGTTP